jgi:TRAP-type C4-dicarboxylate transport system permease small subunit
MTFLSAALLAQTIVLKNPLPKTSDSLFQDVLTIVFGVLGGISLIIITWAGMKYTLSQGDPGKTAEARNQIMYAAIGIGVAVSAVAIVQFVGGKLQ